MNEKPTNPPYHSYILDERGAPSAAERLKEIESEHADDDWDKTARDIDWLIEQLHMTQAVATRQTEELARLRAEHHDVTALAASHAELLAALRLIAAGAVGEWDATYHVTRFMPYGEVGEHARAAIARAEALGAAGGRMSEQGEDACVCWQSAPHTCPLHDPLWQRLAKLEAALAEAHAALSLASDTIADVWPALLGPGEPKVDLDEWRRRWHDVPGTIAAALRRLDALAESPMT